MRHGGDDAQIGVDGDVVGDVPGNDDEDRPAMETARTSGRQRRTKASLGRRVQPCRAVDDEAAGEIDADVGVEARGSTAAAGDANRIT